MCRFHLPVTDNGESWVSISKSKPQRFPHIGTLSQPALQIAGNPRYNLGIEPYARHQNEITLSAAPKTNFAQTHLANATFHKTSGDTGGGSRQTDFSRQNVCRSKRNDTYLRPGVGYA